MLAVRSAQLGLMIFMIAGVALVPLGNRRLSGVFWIGAAVNLSLFCGASLVVPIVLLRRMRAQVATPLRRLVCVLAYAFGWLMLPCAGIVFFVRPTSGLILAPWQAPLLVGMIAAFLLVASTAAILTRRRIE